MRKSVRGLERRSLVERYDRQTPDLLLLVLDKIMRNEKSKLHILNVEQSGNTCFANLGEIVASAESRSG
jgi:hypothetical protein